MKTKMQPKIESSPPAIPFLGIFVGSKIVIWLWQEYLRLRQQYKKQEKAVPEPLVGKIKPEDHLKSQNYTLDKLHFETVKQAIMLAIELSFFVSSACPMVWNQMATVAEKIHLDPKSDV